MTQTHSEFKQQINAARAHLMLGSTKWIALTNSELRTDVGGEIAWVWQ